MSNLFSVVVLQRSMLKWMSVVESVCNGYMCILLYVQLIWCSGFPEIYAGLEEGVESICHGYMCIFLYVKFISFIAFPEICAQLEEGVYLHWL